MEIERETVECGRDWTALALVLLFLIIIIALFFFGYIGVKNNFLIAFVFSRKF